jgi:hypothetical protein
MKNNPNDFDTPIFKKSCKQIPISLPCKQIGLGVRVVVFNATVNNISVLSWRSVLLVEETGVPGENS